MTARFQRRILSLLLATVFVAPVFAQNALDSDEQKAGYSIGVNIGSNLMSQGLVDDLDIKSLLVGIQDGISGQFKITQEEIVAAIQTFSAKQQAKAQASQEMEAKAGLDFLVENGKKTGVKTTASGLQYLVLTPTKDAAARMPKETDTVTVHYQGTLVDGTVFDSSIERNEPATFPLNGVIPGWTEGLQLMKAGEKFRFFVPSELGYGAEGGGPIPPNAVLIFDVELLEVK